MVSFNELFPQVNEKAIIDTVKHFFKDELPKAQRYSHKDISGIKSPTVSDMLGVEKQLNAVTQSANRFYGVSTLKITRSWGRN
ncbi:hypothetical protein [Latilactobacillus sakei]|uniref:hypothetical protein n=1 Tax=Latilactobacillus sakei TaxID=1599 RepID=UPI0020744F04|nr:hypothetical protein [Latilactobacillus sakei]